MDELVGNDGQLLFGFGGKVSPFSEAESEAEAEAEVESAEYSDANASADVDEPRPLNLMLSPPPPPQKLRPIRCSSNSSGLRIPLQTQQQHHVLASANSSNNNWIDGFDSAELGFLHSSQDSAHMLTNAEDVYRTSLLKIKSQMDANFISTMNSQISLLPFSFSSSSDGSGGDSADKRKEDGANVKLKRKKRKKVECFLEELMGKVMQKQEQMHQQLMEIFEKKERERIVREEAWRREEMERAQIEQDMRSQEAARNLTLVSFIQNALAQDSQILLQPLPPPDDAQTQTDPNYKPANV